MSLNGKLAASDGIDRLDHPARAAQNLIGNPDEQSIRIRVGRAAAYGLGYLELTIRTEAVAEYRERRRH